MLREYQLTNFKAFAGPETIPIRPITLIYGPNSSGKSSILQSLLLLKQTLEEANIATPLLPKGKLVDLGDYREFI
ncbi:MAG: AAA family ATPase, partial [Terriglobia bacterium]